MQCALVEAHAMAPSKIASAPSCLPLAAWLRVNLSADVFQLGNKPCPRIASTHRERGLRTATRYGVTAVYLLRSAQYQFCNCGVLCIYACRGRLAL